MWLAHLLIILPFSWLLLQKPLSYTYFVHSSTAVQPCRALTLKKCSHVSETLAASSSVYDFAQLRQIQWLIVHTNSSVHVEISKGMFGKVRTKVYRGYLLGKYPTEPYRSVRNGRNSLQNTPVWFGTNSIPVPDTSVSSA